jgi:hypothetical protein
MTLLLRSISRLAMKPVIASAQKSPFCQPCRGAKMKAKKLEVAPNRYLAYRQVPGRRQPTIVFVPGLHSYSHMNGMTARALLRY